MSHSPTVSTTAVHARAAAPVWQVWTALWIVYLVWGSTYLAIRVTVETIPPLLSASVRFLVAGSVMYAWLYVRRGADHVRVSRAEIAASGVVGAALLLGGNGMVAIAEKSVASGLAALIIASVPLWVVLLRFFSGDKVAASTLAGVFVGFAGVGLLVVPNVGGGDSQTLGVLLLIVASLSWASGSFYSRRVRLPRDPFVSTALQMLCGGVIVGVVGVLSGEAQRFDPSAFSGESVLALSYLIVAGSWLAFSAYTWLLQNAAISKVATYAYVNPVVAVFLGWVVLSEEISVTILVGAAIIVASVAFIVRRESGSAAEDANEALEAGAAPAGSQPSGEAVRTSPMRCDEGAPAS